jgi:hypothetical protein
MAEREYARIVLEIVMVIKSFDVFLRNVNKYPQSSEKDALLGDFSSYHQATADTKQLIDMLRKLRDEPLIEMYKKCRNLANKYNLAVKKIMSQDTDVRISDGNNNNLHIDMDDLSTGWESGAPQRIMGYANTYDEKLPLVRFNLHATYFEIPDDLTFGSPVHATLRLWKGHYDIAGTGGEIGFYGRPEPVRNRRIRELMYQTIQTIADELIPRQVSPAVNAIPDFIENFSLSKAVSIYLDIPQREVLESLRESDRKGLGGVEKMQALGDFIIRRKGLIEGSDDDMFSSDLAPALTGDELREMLGLTGTALQVFNRADDSHIIEHRERSPTYWTTDFTRKTSRQPEEIYTVNHFYFDTSGHAIGFYKKIKDGLNAAISYPGNKETIISIPEMPNSTTVIIVYGKGGV